MLKKINYIFTLLLAILVVACDDDTVENRVQGGSDEISIDIDQSPSDYAPVDLDIEEKPSFSGTIISNADLAKVTISVTGSAGETVLSEVTSFDGHTYSFDETPVYDLTMNTLVASAEDVNGVAVDVIRKILVKGGPGLSLDTDKFEIDLTVNASDTIKGSVSSNTGILSKVVYSITKDGTESVLETVTLSGEDKTEYTISKIVDFEIGVTGLNVTVTDERGNVNSQDIEVNVVASPNFEMYLHAGIELNGTGNRGDAGVTIAVALKTGKAHEMAELAVADANGLGIDMLVASADKSVNKLRYFSASTQFGDKFKLGDENPDLTDLNETTFSVLDRGDAAFFDAATVESIRAMSLEDDGASTTTKLSSIDDKPDSGIDVVGDGNGSGRVVYFETAWGAQCLVIMRKLNLGADHKEDSYEFDFKVVYQTN